MYILLSPVTVGGKQQPCSIMLKLFQRPSARILSEVGKMEYFNAFNSFALHSAYLLQ